jgi:hypothetical protein
VHPTGGSIGGETKNRRRPVGGRRSSPPPKRVLYLHAHLTAADARAQLAGLQRLRHRCLEHLMRLNRRQPEAELVGKVVTRTAGAVAFDERRRAEVLQARSRTRQLLAASFGAGASVLQAEHTNPRVSEQLDMVQRRRAAKKQSAFASYERIPMPEAADAPKLCGGGKFLNVPTGWHHQIGCIRINGKTKDSSSFIFPFAGV